MRIFRQTCIAWLLVVSLGACNYVTYTPRSKKNVRRQQPSILIFSGIVDFRMEQHRWPDSKLDFMSQGKKYYALFDKFPYNHTEFKIVDSNTMTFYFSDHIQDRLNFKETEKVDLNSYSGRAKFYKQNGKFVWKLKMN